MTADPVTGDSNCNGDTGRLPLDSDRDGGCDSCEYLRRMAWPSASETCKSQKSVSS